MSKFKVGDKVRALAKCTDPYYSNEGCFRVGEEFTVKEVFDRQKIVKLVERGHCWHESWFELVEEAKPSEPQPTSFKVGDKVRRKAGDRAFCCWSRGDEVLTISKVSTAYDSNQEVRFEGVNIGWDGYRFELVEEAKPVAPVVPQLPGIPEGFRAVRIGTPQKGEWYVAADGRAKQSIGYESVKGYVILEKIDQPVPVEPAKPEAPAAPAKKVDTKFKVGDKVRLVENTKYEKIPKGTVGIVLSVSRHESAPGLDLMTFDGALKGHGGMFSYRFELVEEAKPGVPALPTTEKVLFTEYVCWDNDGPKSIWWVNADPTVDTDDYSGFDHAHATGNTREVEVPIVKP